MILGKYRHKKQARNLCILLLGYYGEKNTGDDAILLALLEQLHQWYPHAKFIVTANNPIWLHSELAKFTKVVRRNSVLSLVRAVFSCDVLVLGGGTHFHDLNKNPRYFWLLLRYLAIFVFARIQKKRICLIGIGIGPLETVWARFLTKLILQLADFVLARDTISYRTALSLGCEQAHLGFDLSCVLVDQELAVIKESHKKILGISILPAFEIYYHDPSGDLRLINAVATAAITWMNMGPEYRVRLIEFKGRTKETDFGVTMVLHQKLSLYSAQVEYFLHQENPMDMLRIIAECDATISMRYHACLFSYITAVPSIFIDYHSKNASLAEDILLPSKGLISLQSVSAEVLVSRVNDLIEAPESFLAQKPVHEISAQLAQSLAFLSRELIAVLSGYY